MTPRKKLIEVAPPQEAIDKSLGFITPTGCLGHGRIAILFQCAEGLHAAGDA